ncbi:ribulose 1,5-bisphosphate carboxylase, partial [Rhizobium ruizarguesonis]
PGSVDAMAEKIASDHATGTFVPVPGETEELKSRVAARGLAIRSLEDARHPTLPEVAPGTLLNRADVDIAFPLDAIGT